MTSNQLIFDELKRQYQGTSLEDKSLKLTHQFLQAFPENLSWRGSNKPDLSKDSGIKAIGDRFYMGRRTINLPHPSTKTDKAVSIVLTAGYDYLEGDVDEVLKNHQYAMIAENNVGNFLERYVASNVEPLGWAWCSGELVKATDFIAKNSGGWSLLQIKNRNNSENSSSSAIRSGTTIQKWYRSNSQTGNTRWDKFPDEVGCGQLSEEGFLEFTKETIRQFKNQILLA